MALGGKSDAVLAIGGVGGAGAYTMWDLFFSFFNGIPYMTESDKKRTPSAWAVSLARLLGSASWKHLSVGCAGPAPPGAPRAPLLQSALVRGGCGERETGNLDCSLESWGSQASPYLPLYRWPPSLQKRRAEGGSLRLYPLSGFDFSGHPLGLRGFEVVLKRKADHLLVPSSSQ